MDGDRARTPDWRWTAGALVGACGVVAWVVIAALVEPAMRDLVHTWPVFDPQLGHPVLPHGDPTGFQLLGHSVRWAAVLLAVGGLVIATGSGWDRAAIAAGAVAWLVADVTLDATNAATTVTLAVGGAVLAAAAVLLLRRTSRARTRVPSRVPWSLVSAGVLVGVGSQLLFLGEGWMADVLPAWMMPTLVALSVLLVVAGVLTALAAAPQVSWRRTMVASVIAMAAAAADYGLNAWRLADRPGGRAGAWELLLEPALTGCVVVACAALAGLDRAPARWAFAGVVIAAPFIAWVAFAAGMILTVKVQVGLAAPGSAMTLDPWEVGPAGTPVGLLVGTALGLLVLIPRAVGWTTAGAPVRRT